MLAAGEALGRLAQRARQGREVAAARRVALDRRAAAPCAAAMPQRPAARVVAIAMYGLMSAAVCRYSRRVDFALPGMARMAQVRFSTPQLALSGAHTPGT